MLSVASHSGTLLVLAMAIRSDFHETFRRIARLFYWFPKSLTCSKNRKSKLLWSQGGEGKYICHAHCRDLVHLDYPQNGNVSSCMPTSEVRYSIKKNSQDVEKEKETHSYLSKEEIKEKVHKYNLAVTDKLKMTLNSNGIYTGFIKVQMELCKPPQTSPNSGKLSPSSNGCMNTLHISSTNTVGEVIEALLKKFLVTESPAKFALYKRCHREDQVYACKLSDREHPLYLRLVAGPRTDTLSFVLREHEIGEWEAFSLPELQNFLRILDKEEDEQLQNLKRRYTAYRQKLEEALREVWKPD
ncbi:Ras association domain family member 3 [Homo sapiens]|uniref:Ras association domain-containing protein 3 n=2 Tax=Homo sapiens TaxID=9606 RepID=A0A1B0GUG6_HUMAN|nr:Ras association domain family member 3 [Homo sapiens]KAI4067039.1 Ras association domain family member 3 [Homo sapiens]